MCRLRHTDLFFIMSFFDMELYFSCYFHDLIVFIDVYSNLRQTFGESEKQLERERSVAVIRVRCTDREMLSLDRRRVVTSFLIFLYTKTAQSISRQ
jgi:hypothetical protein|nr:MAG TPA: hypothetical protein [Caudoviricetes sp.]